MRFILAGLAIALSSCGPKSVSATPAEVTIKLPPPTPVPGFGKPVSRL